MSMFSHRQVIIEKVRERFKYLESILDDIGTDDIDLLLFKLEGFKKGDEE